MHALVMSDKHLSLAVSWSTLQATRQVGLGPGSSSQYSMYWQRHMPVHWTRPVHWWFRRSRNRPRLRRDPCPPPAGEEDPPEVPPEGPAGGTLPEARFKAIWLH